MILLKFISTFILLILASEANQINQYTLIDFPGTCPKQIKYVSNQDYGLLQGAWYVQYLSSNGSMFGCDGTCWTLYAAQILEDELTVNLCCQKDGKPFCHTKVGSGSLTMMNGCQMGLHVYLHDDISLPSVALDIDYDSYWLGYVCDDVGHNNAFVFTRHPHPPQGFEDLVYTSYGSVGVEAQSLVKIWHSHACNYPFGCTSKQHYNNGVWKLNDDE